MIPIYKYEKEAGIADIIRQNNSISIASQIKVVEVNNDNMEIINEMIKRSTGTANPEQIDLFYLESILVSVGWNKNDDVFDRTETWLARNTPVDKPFNFMHDEKDIIGHITSSRVIDENKKIVASDIDIVDDIPLSFDIVVGSVIYKSWSDQERQKRMNDIIAGIIKGQWFVSMECLFKNFDYAMVSPNGEHKVLARNESTSFLTKHLRIYGGDGIYEGNKVGRLLRNFAFSGKGLVNNPANPKSLIVSYNSKEEISSFTAASIGKKPNKELKMADTVTYTEVQYNELKKELDEIKSVAKAAVDKEVTSLKAEVAKLSDTNKTLANELEASKTVLSTKDERVVALEKQLEETKSELQKAIEEINNAKIAATKAARKAKLVERGCAEDRADALIEKFVNASDEMFSELVNAFPPADAAKKEMPEDMKKEKKEDKAKCSEDATAEEKVLEEAAKAAEEEVTMNTSTEDAAKAIRSKASSWLSEGVLRYSQKS